MSAQPSCAFYLRLERFRDFWFPRIQEHPYKIAVLWFATLLSIPGLCLMGVRRIRVTGFVLGVLFAYPLMYYIVVSDVRYRYPIVWLPLLPAGYCIHSLVVHYRNRCDTAMRKNVAN